MILHGVKQTIQPLGVGYANRPKKGGYKQAWIESPEPLLEGPRNKVWI